MPNKKTYQVGKEKFDIPVEETQAFLADYPDAVELSSFVVGGKDTFDIPLPEVEAFIADNPDAKPTFGEVKKKEITAKGGAFLGGGSASPSPSTKTVQGSSILPSGKGVDLLRGRSVKPASATLNEKPQAKKPQKETTDIISEKVSDFFIDPKNVEAKQKFKEKVTEDIDLGKHPDLVDFYESKKSEEDFVKSISLDELQETSAGKLNAYQEDKNSLANYLQSKEGKVSNFANEILKGNELDLEDAEYLKRTAPKVYADLLGSTEQFNNDFPIENINTIAYINKQKNDAANRAAGYKNIQKSIVDVSTFTNPQDLGTGKILTDLNKVSDARQVEIKNLEELYPQKLVDRRRSITSEFGDNELAPRPPEYYKQLGEINAKYDQVLQKSANAESAQFAIKNKANVTALQAGEKYLQIARPTDYQTYMNSGQTSEKFKQDATEVGIAILQSSGDPQLISKGEAEQQQFDKNFPGKRADEVRRKLMIEALKKQGGANWLFNSNVIPVKIADGLRDQLNAADKKVYDEVIRPQAISDANDISPFDPVGSFKSMLGIESEAKIVTPAAGGWVNKLYEGVNIPIGGTVKTITNAFESKKATAKRALDEDVPMWQQSVIDRNQIVDRVDELKAMPELGIDEAKELVQLQSELDLKSKAQVNTDNAASLTGQVVGMAGLTLIGGPLVGRVGNMVQAGATEVRLGSSIAKIAQYTSQLKNQSSIASSFVAYMSSYDDAKLEAERLMPNGSILEKKLYASGVASLNALTERIFKDEKIFDAFRREVSPQMSVLVRELSAGNITETVFRNNLKNLVTKTLPKYGTAILVNNQQEAAEEVATSVGTTILKELGVLTGAIDKRDFNTDDEIDAAIQTWQETTLSGVPVSVLGGISDVRRNRLNKKAVYDLGSSKEKTNEFIDIIRAQRVHGTMTDAEAIKKIQTANTLSEIATTTIPLIEQKKKLTDQEKVELTNLMLAERQIQSEIKNPELSVNKTLNEKQLSEIQKKKDAILNDEVIVDENYVAYTPQEFNEKVKAEKESAITPQPILVSEDQATGKFTVNNPNGTKEQFDTQEAADARVVVLSNDVAKAIDLDAIPDEPPVAVAAVEEVKIPSRNNDFVNKFFSDEEKSAYDQLEPDSDAAKAMVTAKREEIRKRPTAVNLAAPPVNLSEMMDEKPAATSPIDRAKEIANSGTVTGFLADDFKKTANTDEAKFTESLLDIAEQAADPKSRPATIKTYGQELVDIAESLPKREAAAPNDVSVPIEEGKEKTVRPVSKNGKIIIDENGNLSDELKGQFEQLKKDNDLKGLDDLYSTVRIFLNGVAQSKGENTVAQFESFKKEIEDYAKELKNTKAPTTTAVTNDALKDVESTAKALEEVSKTDKKKFNYLIGFADPTTEKVGVKIPIENILETNLYGQKLSEAMDTVKKGLTSKTVVSPTVYEENGKYIIVDGFHRIAKAKLDGEKNIKVDIVKPDSNKLSEYYHQSKSDGTNPELVKAVESALATNTPTEKPKADALKDVEYVNDFIKSYGLNEKDFSDIKTNVRNEETRKLYNAVADLNGEAHYTGDFTDGYASKLREMGSIGYEVYNLLNSPKKAAQAINKYVKEVAERQAPPAKSALATNTPTEKPKADALKDVEAATSNESVGIELYRGDVVGVNEFTDNGTGVHLTPNEDIAKEYAKILQKEGVERDATPMDVPELPKEVIEGKKDLTEFLEESGYLSRMREEVAKEKIEHSKVYKLLAKPKKVFVQDVKGFDDFKAFAKSEIESGYPNMKKYVELYNQYLNTPDGSRTETKAYLESNKIEEIIKVNFDALAGTKFENFGYKASNEVFPILKEYLMQNNYDAIERPYDIISEEPNKVYNYTLGNKKWEDLKKEIIILNPKDISESALATNTVEGAETKAAEPKKVFAYDNDGNLIEVEVVSEKGINVSVKLPNGNQAFMRKTDIFPTKEDAEKNGKSKAEGAGTKTVPDAPRQSENVSELGKEFTALSNKVYTKTGKEKKNATPADIERLKEVTQLLAKEGEAAIIKEEEDFRKQQIADTKALNEDFEKRAYEGLTDQEKFEAVIEDKQNTQVELTDKELEYVNENYFLPKGFEYTKDWDLTPKKELQSTNIIEDETENISPESESVVASVESKAASSEETQLNESIQEADAIIEAAAVDIPKKIKAKRNVLKKVKEIVSLKRLNLKEQKEDFLAQLSRIEGLVFAQHKIPLNQQVELRKAVTDGMMKTPFYENDFQYLKDKGFEVNGANVQIVVKDNGTFSFPINDVIEVSEMVRKSFPTNEQIKSKSYPSPIRRSPQKNNAIVALSRGSVEKNQQFVNTAQYNVNEAKKVLQQAKVHNDKETQRAAEKLIEVFEEDLKYQEGVLASAKRIDYEVETNAELLKIADDIDVSPRAVLDAIQKYNLKLSKKNAEKALFMDDMDKNYGGLESARDNLMQERDATYEKLKEFEYKDGRAGYKVPATNNKKAELNRLRNSIDGTDAKLKYLTDNFKEESPKVSDKIEKDKKGKKVAEVAQPKENLQDYGEKIGGAKKDLAQKLGEVTTEDIASQPLSKTFPEPDYAKLVADEILDENGAIIMKFLYDVIPPKPRKSYKVNSWTKQVQAAIDMFKDLIENKEGNAKKLFDNVANSKTLGDKFTIFAQTLKGLGFPTTNVKLGNYEIKKFYSSHRKNAEGNFVPDPYTRISIVSGNSIIKDFDTVEDAIEGMRLLLDKNKEAGSKGTKFEVYQDKESKTYFIGKKTAVRVIHILDGFKTAKEAFAFIKEKSAELQSIWDGMKSNPDERRNTNRERIGPDYRNGKNVSSEDFAKTFGFRGVEFGNWVAGTERQSHVNEAYDALMDMANVIGVPPGALSLNGELGFAFGARGSGKHSAHYEPGKVVINLTKTKGAGSLAHEWWHALDNYFSRMRGRKSEFITDSPRQRMKNDGTMDESVRNEVLEAFKGVMDAIGKSKLAERSRVLDSTKSKLYWSTPIEMSARSFENYIIEKLGEAGNANDYLANFKETSEWMNETGGDIDALKNYPYPLADESPAVNEAFQQLFDAIETKRVGDTDVMFMNLANEPLVDTITPEAFNELIGKLKEAFPGVNVFHDKATLSKKLKGDGIELRTVNGTIYGTKFTDGSIYINTDALNANAPIHEFSHLWEQYFPREWKRGVDMIMQSKEGKKIFADLKANPTYSGKPDAEIWSEALNVAIGNNGEQFVNNKNLFSKFSEWVKTLFKRLGDRLGIRNMTPDEKLQDFTKKVVGKLLGGKPLVNEISKTGNNKLSLQNIQDNESANNYTTSLKRLFPAEERGRNSSGEINEIASTLLNRLHDAVEAKYGSNSQELSSIANEEETYLEDLSKQGDFWFDDADIQFGTYYDKGQEQSVYIDPADTTIVAKLNNGSLSNNWLDLLDRVALHNTYFPSTSYTVKGFGRTTDGDFVAILEQPFIISHETNADEIKAYMKGRGYELLSKYDDSIIGTVEEDRSFINKDTGIIVEDLHLKNVLKDDKENMFVIDPVISLDTKDRGYGGTRIVNPKGSPQFMASAENLADLFPDLSYDRIDQVKTIVQRGQSREKLQALVDNLVANGQLGNDFITNEEEGAEVMRLYDYLTKDAAPIPTPTPTTEPEPAPEPKTEKPKLPPPPPPRPPKESGLSAEEDRSVNRILNKRLDEYNYPNLLFDENLQPIEGEFKQLTAETQGKYQDRNVDGTYVKLSLDQLRDISLQTARELQALLGSEWAEKTLDYMESGGGTNPAQAIGVLNVISTQIFEELQAEGISTSEYNDLRSQQKRVDLLANDKARQIALGLNMRRIYKIFADGGNINSAVAEALLPAEVRAEIDALKESISRAKSDSELAKSGRPVTPTSKPKSTTRTTEQNTKTELRSRVKDKSKQLNKDGKSLLDRVQEIKDKITKTKCP